MPDLKLTWRLIHTDNVINWVLGISLILVPDFFNKILFGQEVLSHWLYIVAGVSLLWSAVWQVDNLIKPRQLDVPKLRFSALIMGILGLILLWLCWALWGRLILLGKVGLIISLLYLFILSGWFGWVSQK
jgi:hypothetical protein